MRLGVRRRSPLTSAVMCGVVFGIVSAAAIVVATESDARPLAASAALHWHLVSLNVGRPTHALPARAWPTLSAVDDSCFELSGAIRVRGDFNGDGAIEQGLFLDGQWFIDLNGNDRWDRDDLWVHCGTAGDLPITGDWDGDGKTDIGVVGRAWLGDDDAVALEPGLPDADNPNQHPSRVASPAHRKLPRVVLHRTAHALPQAAIVAHVMTLGEIGDLPVVGDFNGDGIDNIGVFRQGVWLLDSDGDGRFTRADRRVQLGEAGDRPLIVDLDADSIVELGVERTDGRWFDRRHDGALSKVDDSF